MYSRGDLQTENYERRRWTVYIGLVELPVTDSRKLAVRYWSSRVEIKLLVRQKPTWLANPTQGH